MPRTGTAAGIFSRGSTKVGHHCELLTHSTPEVEIDLNKRRIHFPPVIRSPGLKRRSKTVEVSGSSQTSRSKGGAQDSGDRLLGFRTLTWAPSPGRPRRHCGESLGRGGAAEAAPGHRPTAPERSGVGDLARPRPVRTRPDLGRGSLPELEEGGLHPSARRPSRPASHRRCLTPMAQAP